MNDLENEKVHIAELARRNGISIKEARKVLRKLTSHGLLKCDGEAYEVPEQYVQVSYEWVKSQWKGDPTIFTCAAHREKFRELVTTSGEGIGILSTYLFFFEKAGKEACSSSTPIEVQLAPGEEEEFENDPSEQRRLTMIARWVLNGPPGGTPQRSITVEEFVLRKSE